MKILKKIKFSLFVLILLVLTGCGEYIPSTVVYDETPITYITHQYPRYYYHYRYRPYYRHYVIKEVKVEHFNHNSTSKVRITDNRNKRPIKNNRRR